MKTKIMLFCAVILAVTLIGLARPATRAEAEPAMDIVITGGPTVSENSPAPPTQEIQATEKAQEQRQTEEKKAQEKQQQEQAQQEQVEAKEKQEPKAKKQPVVWTIKEGEKHKHKYQIRIQKGDKVKTIVIEKPVIIKEDKEGLVFIITPGDKEVKVLEGDPVHLEIIGDKLEFIKEGRVVKVGKDSCCIYVSLSPDVDVGKAVKIALKEIPVAVKVAEPLMSHITLEPGVDVGTHLTPHVTRVAKDLQDDLRERLRDIREKLKEVEEKKLNLREVDEALADLEKELEKMSLDVHMDKPDVFIIEPKKGHEEAGQEIGPDIGVDISEHAHKNGIKVIVKENGSFSLYCQIEPGEKGREVYARILARVKSDLPEGFALEPSFEDESGLVTLKVSGPFGEAAPHDIVQKLADSIRDETKEKQE